MAGAGVVGLAEGQGSEGDGEEPGRRRDPPEHVTGCTGVDRGEGSTWLPAVGARMPGRGGWPLGDAQAALHDSVLHVARRCHAAPLQTPGRRQASHPQKTHVEFLLNLEKQALT